MSAIIQGIESWIHGILSIESIDGKKQATIVTQLNELIRFTIIICQITTQKAMNGLPLSGESTR